MNVSDKTKDGWTLQGEHEWDECSVQFSGSGCYHTIYEPGRRLPIAFVIGSSEYWRDSEAEDTARARLIAAAPEMFEALPDLSAVIAWLENGCEVTHAVTELRIHQARIDAARSKATGDA